MSKHDVHDLLTVRELHAALTEALARGLDPSTAVVIGPEDHDWQQTSQTIGDPTLNTEEGEWLWFTLFTAAPADPRSTYAHVAEWTDDRCACCGTVGHDDDECPSFIHPELGMIYGYATLAEFEEACAAWEERS